MDGIEVGAGFLDPELPSKYETLNDSLTKEKMKVASLKQALTEAQIRTNQQDKKITEQSQRIRQFDSEQDSLLFRNSQISKRVEVLQEDIQSMLTVTSTKKQRRPTTPLSNLSLQNDSGSRSSSTTSLPNSVAHDGTTLEAFAADLANKIAENERLHNEIFELSTKNRTQRIELEDRISELQKDYESLSKEHTEQQTQFETSKQEIENKNVLFIADIEKKNEENRTLSQELSELKDTLYNLQNKSKTDNEHNLQIIRDKIPFIDNETPGFNTYNLPIYDNTLHNNFTQIFKQISNLFIAFCSQTSLLHSYIESSIKNIEHDPDSSLKVVQAKFISKLHRTKFYSKPIENCLILIVQAIETSENFLECETFNDLHNNLALFVNYVRIIAKYHILYIREESTDISFTNEMRKCNLQLQNLIEFSPIPLEKLLGIVSILGQVVSAEIYPRLIENLQVNLLQLSINTQDISLCFTNKFKLEELAKLDRADSEKLTADNQCIMTSLAGLINTTERLMRCFTDSLPVITAYGNIALKSQSQFGSNNDTKVLREKAREYIDSLNVQPPDALLYPVSLALSNQVFTYIPDKYGDSAIAQPRDRIVVQLQSTQNSLAMVEREKENLAIELELMKMQQRLKPKTENNQSDDFDRSATDSDTQLIDLSESSSLDASSIENIVPSKQTDVMDTNNVGEDSVNIFDNSSLLDGEREKLIRLYYTTRVSQLTEQLQTSDCNSTYYYNEIKSISKHISHLQQLRKRDLHQIEDSNNKIEQLKADLETTQKGYEHQLNVMSETMLSLNEQLSLRQDEIERLSSEFSPRKKQKNKS
ncbi:Protein phosphatase 1 regulatory subunit 21 isoform X1 [Oopsacas minuta]|uniref:Protein phosphatase 1 regulatory subunit 21 n=1 Tax=Oopsacas minuta TaxID=111878 RepID=A0AAV7JL40_9METZ|nr:Protein phosphatase 1 regulatory subunit 21 isoform X1 [Oopsacas minuta]